MKIPAKIRAKRIVEDWDGQPVRVDLITGPRRKTAESSVSAAVMHSGPKPTAVIDLSLSIQRPSRLRELSAWLNRVADYLDTCR